MRKGLRAGRSGRVFLEGLESRVMMAADLPGVILVKYAVGNGSAVFVKREGAVETRVAVGFAHGVADTWNVGLTARNTETGAVLMDLKGVSQGLNVAWPSGTATLAADGRSMRVAGTFALAGNGGTSQVGVDLAWTLDAGSIDTEVWNLGVSAELRTLEKTSYHRGGAVVAGTVVAGGAAVFSGTLAGQSFNSIDSQLNKLGAGEDVRSWAEWMTPPADAPKGARVHARRFQELNAELEAGRMYAGGVNVGVDEEYFTNPLSMVQAAVFAQSGTDVWGGNVGGLVGIADDFSGAAAELVGSANGTAITADLTWRAVAGSTRTTWSRSVTTAGDAVTTDYSSMLTYDAEVRGGVQLGNMGMTAGTGTMRRSIDVSIQTTSSNADGAGATAVGPREWRAWVLQVFCGNETAADGLLKGTKKAGLKYAYQQAVLPVLK